MLSQRPTSQLIRHVAPRSPSLAICKCIRCITHRTYAGQAPAPSTRRAQARQDGPLFGITSVKKDVFLPSLSLLRSAKTSDTITVEPEHVLRLLTAYVTLGRDASPSRVDRLCAEHNIPPTTLHHIAITLLRSTGPPHHALAKHILLTASKLGIPEATYILISEGLRRDRLSQSQLQPALTHLSRLASRGTDIRALVLWGQVLLSTGQEKQAMKVFQKAIDEDQTSDNTGKDQGSQDSSPFRISTSKAYTLLASHHLKTNNISLAQSLSKRAAEKYNDMESWLCLAQTQPLDSPERENYLTHAAAKGSLEAANELGEYFLRRSRDDSNANGRIEKNNKENRMWAKEWFGLGTHEGVPRNQEEVMKLLA